MQIIFLEHGQKNSELLSFNLHLQISKERNTSKQLITAHTLEESQERIEQNYTFAKNPQMVNLFILTEKERTRPKRGEFIQNRGTRFCKTNKQKGTNFSAQSKTGTRNRIKKQTRNDTRKEHTEFQAKHREIQCRSHFTSIGQKNKASYEISNKSPKIRTKGDEKTKTHKKGKEKKKKKRRRGRCL